MSTLAIHNNNSQTCEIRLVWKHLNCAVIRLQDKCGVRELGMSCREEEMVESPSLPAKVSPAYCCPGDCFHLFTPRIKKKTLMFSGERGSGWLRKNTRQQKKSFLFPRFFWRYRLRKRAELDSLEEELHCLEGQNRELRDKAESVEREIQYVKDLLIEVYKARSQRLKQDGSA